MVYNKMEKARIETILDYHIGRERDQKPVSEQVRILMMKKRRFLFITLINVLAIVFFGYWFVSDMTQLADWIIWVLAAVFVLNLLSVFYQKKQIEMAINYLQSGAGSVNR